MESETADPEKNITFRKDLQPTGDFKTGRKQTNELPILNADKDEDVIVEGDFEF